MHNFEWFARFGLAARGLVYAVVGVLAVKLATGNGGETTSHEGALQKIAQQPFGELLLILVAVGLFGYSLWRLVRAALGHGVETGDDDAKERVRGLASGIVYGALCFVAVQILAGSGGGGGGHEDAATGGVLGWPGGQWIVAIAGIVLVGVAVDQGMRGLRRTVLEESKVEQMSAGTQRVFTAVGVFGYLARMVVFALMGYFLFRAAIDFDPDKAIALDGALAKLAAASYGPFLLGVVALGLLGYAALSTMEARYRRV
jgi:hypothetical protein